MSNAVNLQTAEDPGKFIMDLLISLLEDQTGKSYTYERIDDSGDDTAGN